MSAWVGCWLLVIIAIDFGLGYWDPMGSMHGRKDVQDVCFGCWMFMWHRKKAPWGEVKFWLCMHEFTPNRDLLEKALILLSGCLRYEFWSIGEAHEHRTILAVRMLGCLALASKLHSHSKLKTNPRRSEESEQRVVSEKQSHWTSECVVVCPIRFQNMVESLDSHIK